MSSDAPAPAAAAVYKPPTKIEEYYAVDDGNKFSSINAPTAGARVQEALPAGSAAVQLYSLATPNGHKVGILFEELGLEYDAHTVNIMKGIQFHSGFVDINPNSKIPCAVDADGPDGQPINLFESGSIMLYFADKHNKFSFKENPRLRQELTNWLMWQMAGQGPMAGNFGHFFSYAPEDQVQTREYGAKRYGMETQRLCDVLERHLATRQYMVGEEYSLADMAIFPWFQQLRTGYLNKATGLKAAGFLSVEKYVKAGEWADRILARPAVQRGVQVCGWSSPNPKPWLEEKKEEDKLPAISGEKKETAK